MCLGKVVVQGGVGEVARNGEEGGTRKGCYAAACWHRVGMGCGCVIC